MKPKNIYLIAICGTGMAALAGLLKKAGHRVKGSDANIYPPMSTLLNAAGITIFPGYKKENISKDIDLVVVGNAISKTNEEVKAVLKAGIPYTSFPAALAKFFLEGRKSLVVAGTHGKTTTASMLSWVLESAKRKPGFMVGGWLKNFDSNHQIPKGEYFVTEGDEYDSAFFDKGPKFLHYQPYASILTSIEFDHADIFKDLDEIKKVFRDYVELLKSGSILLVKSDDSNIKEVVKSAACNLETYGFHADADWHIQGYRFEKRYGHFSLFFKNKHRGDFKLAMMGRHNAENAAAVAGLCFNLGLTAEEINKGFETFKGIKRRQELVGEKNGVIIIDDFAHHPTAINLTIDAIKKAYPTQRIWAIFEPRSATSRRKNFETSFPKSFLKADRVILSGLFSPEKIMEEERLDLEAVAVSIRKLGGVADIIPQVDDIVDYIIKNTRQGDVLLIMSSGGFGGIHLKILEAL